MRAIGIQGGKGDADALEVHSVPVPEVPPGHVLIRVHAAGVNRPDMLQRAGRYPPPPGASDILGLEVAGEVAAVGRGVERWREGDRVTALLSGGTILGSNLLATLATPVVLLLLPARSLEAIMTHQGNASDVRWLGAALGVLLLLSHRDAWKELNLKKGE